MIVMSIVLLKLINLLMYCNIDFKSKWTLTQLGRDANRKTNQYKLKRKKRNFEKLG
jgi:hypothetical protein